LQEDQGEIEERYMQARSERETTAHIATLALRGTFVWNVATTVTTQAASVVNAPTIPVKVSVQAATKSINTGKVSAAYTA
jgi:hypothetical protein